MTETERLQAVIDNQRQQLELMQRSGSLFLKAKWKLDAIRKICEVEQPGQVLKIKEILEGK